ncbi:E3 ubiquitin-protein ligase RNF19B-like [Triplophysa rosa]|uniref:E3 ubiquitin-protein ligase RNF19B-like n=1 Tax=Triplophysa rosa TaxID=992332 RepID=UPI00254630CE|nr:E3 ubiquitin-protein ligase RNF19B-like [Triplophysa rosa]
MAFQVRVKLNRTTIKTLSVATSEEEFLRTTTKDLKEKALHIFPGVSDVNRLRMFFGQLNLEDDKTLEFYKIKHFSVVHIVLKMPGKPENRKKFTPFDEGIKLVTKPSDLDESDNDQDVLRAELSCGHVTGPESLMDCCKAQLNEGKMELMCPLCDREWPYDEVRCLAKLSLEEQKYFEDLLATNTVNNIADCKDCPGCGFFIEREQTSNLCVTCLSCTARTGKLYEFCWQCEREWKGPRPRADQCDNVGCNSDELDLLRECPEITIRNVLCPHIRACPNCSVLIEHTTEGCNNMTCQMCSHTFCFVCLNRVCVSANCTAAPRQIP